MSQRIGKVHCDTLTNRMVHEHVVFVVRNAGNKRLGTPPTFVAYTCAPSGNEAMEEYECASWLINALAGTIVDMPEAQDLLGVLAEMYDQLGLKNYEEGPNAPL